MIRNILVLFSLLAPFAAYSNECHVRENKDAITDSLTTYAVCPADKHNVPSWRGAPALVLRCRDNEAEVFIDWHEFLGTDSMPMITRLNDNDAETSTWGISNDHTALFYLGDALALQRQLIGSHLIARVTPYNKSPRTAHFTITSNVAKVVNACSTPPSPPEEDAPED